MYWPTVLNKNLSGVATVFYFLLTEITSGVLIFKKMLNLKLLFDV
jgi:hypothetical protein